MFYTLKILFTLELLLAGGMVAFRAALLPTFRNVLGARARFLLLALPAAALLSGNIYIFLALLFCATAFTCRTRADLGITYLLLIPMVPSLQQNVQTSSLWLIPISAPVALNAGALVGILLTPRTVRRPDPLLDACAFILVMLFVFIDARGTSFTNALRCVATGMLNLFPPYLIASRCFRGVEEMRRALVVLCAAALIGSIIAVFGMLRRWDLYEPFYAALHLDLPLGSSYTAVRGGRMRMGGPFLNYTVFGLFVATALVALPSIRGAFRARWFPAVAACLLLGLFATQSRGAWLALLAGYAAMQVLRGRGGFALGVLGVAGTAYAVLSSVLAPSSQLAETIGIGGSSSETADYRHRLLTQGLEQVAAHPLSGQAPSQLVANLSSMVQGQHIVDFVNTHLYVAMAAGIPGLLLWIVVWSVPTVRLGPARGRQPWAGRSGLLVVPVGIITASMTALAFTSWSDRALYFSVLALGLTRVALAAGQETRPGSRLVPPRPMDQLRQAIY